MKTRLGPQSLGIKQPGLIPQLGGIQEKEGGVPIDVKIKHYT